MISLKQNHVLATKFIYIMYLVNSGKPIEIGHAHQMIYGVMPLFQVSVVSVCSSLHPLPRYLRNESHRPTKFGYVMYLVNCGKPIEIGHARHRIMHDHRSHQTSFRSLK